LCPSLSLLSFRDDVNEFLPIYLEQKILAADPFVEIDQEGVGSLIKVRRRKGSDRKIWYHLCLPPPLPSPRLCD